MRALFGGTGSGAGSIGPDRQAPVALRTLVGLLGVALSVTVTACAPGGQGHVAETAPANTPALSSGAWPMYGRDLSHTRRSPFLGPESAAQEWICRSGGGIVYSSPAIAQDGTIYVGTRDGLCAVRPDGTKKWVYKSGPIVSSPAIARDGTIYVGSRDGCLHAVGPNGVGKWVYKTGGMVDSSPAIGQGGLVFVGSRDQCLHAVNPDGTRKWVFRTGDFVDSSPAVDSSGTVFVVSDDLRLYAVNPDGTKKWAYVLGDMGTSMMMSSPLVDSRKIVYVSGEDGKLRAVNPDGTTKWVVDLGGMVLSSPALASDGTLYIGNGVGLHAMGVRRR
jgi:outer membrane protein assembly factor BamB